LETPFQRPKEGDCGPPLFGNLPRLFYQRKGTFGPYFVTALGSGGGPAANAAGLNMPGGANYSNGPKGHGIISGSGASGNAGRLEGAADSKIGKGFSWGSRGPILFTKRWPPGKKEIKRIILY